MKTRISLTFLAAAAIGSSIPLLAGVASPTESTAPAPPPTTHSSTWSAPNCRDELRSLTSSIGAHQQLYGGSRRPGTTLQTRAE